jgi:hypothetical protein
VNIHSIIISYGGKGGAFVIPLMKIVCFPSAGVILSK